jgi:hydroxymethylglutaryl-CoA reductase
LRRRTLVTTHQIRNVLRVYGNQLKRRNTLVQETLGPDRTYRDRVDISAEARHRQALNRMSERVISQIPVPTGSGQAVEARGDVRGNGQGEAE